MSQVSIVKDKDGKPERDKDGNVKAERIQLEKPILRFSNVFHASQIDGIPEWDGREISWNPDERAEAILENSGASITHDQRDRAFYRPSSDEIHLPPHAPLTVPTNTTAPPCTSWDIGPAMNHGLTVNSVLSARRSTPRKNCVRK